MIENQNAEQISEEQIEIEVTEDPIEGQEGQAQEPDELERYTKSVSKRINKLNAKTRDAETRAQQLEQVALQKEQELQQYRQYAVQQQSAVIESESEKIKAQESQVDDIFKKAVESGDADLMSKATTLKNDLAIKKEKLRVAQSRQVQPEAYSQGQENYQTYQQPAQQNVQQQEVEPTSEALSWHESNPWYGDQENEENKQATQFAYFTHYNLINEGYEPDSDEYYQALDSRVGKVYPTLKSNTDSDGQVDLTRERPAVQRVAPTSAGGRQQTRGNQNGVKFSKSELERLRGLKPHNMTEEAWLQRVAKEKQKIAQKEAS
tara:strand:+ start:2360 stop:3319 length:960 start_codon:yes stop_codon:yes gene_type:complete